MEGMKLLPQYSQSTSYEIAKLIVDIAYCYGCLNAALKTDSANDFSVLVAEVNKTAKGINIAKLISILPPTQS